MSSDVYLILYFMMIPLRGSRGMRSQENMTEVEDKAEPVRFCGDSDGTVNGKKEQISFYQLNFVEVLRFYTST